MIKNLGRVLSIIAHAEAREYGMHADVSAFDAPSECHDDVSRGEAKRLRRARRQACAEAQRPLHVIEREARKRGMPTGGPKWDRFVSRVYGVQGWPFALLLAVMLSGCMQATANWTKPGASASDIERAQLECKFEAAKSDVTFTNTTWQTELQQMSIIDACLRAKGYSR